LGAANNAVTLGKCAAGTCAGQVRFVTREREIIPGANYRQIRKTADGAGISERGAIHLFIPGSIYVKCSAVPVNDMHFDESGITALNTSTIKIATRSLLT